jgi:hypothetical protein
VKQFLKNLCIRVLGAANAFPTPSTDGAELAALVARLHPVSPGKGLIRLGPPGDGGYLVPDDLAGIEACFSPGVSDVSGFEKDCAELGMQVFLADKSVDGPAVPHDRFRFTKKYVGATTSDDFMTMDDWVNSSLPGSQSDLILQMDTEGYEYETFLRMSDSMMKRFRIMVAEFHWLDMLWSRPFFRVASSAFERILQSHACVHLHPNNSSGCLVKRHLTIPRSMEFTFLRRDRVGNPAFACSFPHALDCDNTNKPSLSLPKCWYAQSGTKG